MVGLYFRPVFYWEAFSACFSAKFCETLKHF